MRLIKQTHQSKTGGGRAYIESETTGLILSGLTNKLTYTINTYALGHYLKYVTYKGTWVKL